MIWWCVWLFRNLSSKTWGTKNIWIHFTN